jgi:hypothetical protein
MRLRRLVGILAVAALVAVGAATAASGWQTHRSAAGRFSLAAPASWVDATRVTPKLLSQGTIPARLKVYVELARKTKAIKMLLVDLGRESLVQGFATNANAVQTPFGGDLEFFRRVEVAQLTGTGVLVGAPHASFTTLPAGRAVQVTYRLRSQGRVLSGMQFALLRAGIATVVTYTTTKADEALFRPVFVRSIRSLRFS